MYRLNHHGDIWAGTVEGRLIGSVIPCFESAIGHRGSCVPVPRVGYSHLVLFNVATTTSERRVTIRVVGDIDIAALPQVAGELSKHRSPELVLDLRDVDYFDPLCSGLIVAAHLRSRRNGSAFMVRLPADAPGNQLTRLFEESGLDTIVSVVVEAD